MSSTAVLTASKLMQFSDGHEFEANLSIHHQVGACLTLTDAFGNEVEVVSEENIQALRTACDWALLRAQSARAPLLAAE